MRKFVILALAIAACGQLSGCLAAAAAGAGAGAGYIYRDKEDDRR